MIRFQFLLMTESDPQPAPALDEETKKTVKLPVLVITNDVIGITGTALWILVTFFLDLPLFFFPFLTATAMGLTLRKLSGGGVGKRLMVYCGTIALILGVLGNIFTTVLLASSGEETSTSLQDLYDFLLVPGQLVNVIKEALTPMDLLIYSFIPLLAGLLAKGPLFGDDEPPTAEQLPVATAIAAESEHEVFEEGDDLPPA